MKVCIVLNGEIKDYSKVKANLSEEKYNYIICCDGGANHTYKMNIVPNYIIGDLDSIENEVIDYYKTKKVIFKEFPSKKNETDMELGIYLAKSLGALQIDFIGALGGRIDHTIANINILSYVRDLEIKTKILSEKETIYLIKDEEIKLEGTKGSLVSVIPINGDAKGVTLKGLEYTLENYDMVYSIPLGISNAILDKEFTIKVECGNLLIIKHI